MKWTYLLVDLGTIFIPFLFSFHPKIRFDLYFKPYILANLVSAFLFLVWDVLFTRWGVWGFNEKYVTGLYIDHLPVEEILFFFCIPFSCVFTYHCFRLFFRIQWRPAFTKAGIPLLATLLLIIGLFFYDQAYTSMTFVSLALLIFIAHFALRVNWLDKLITTYIVLLLPFFIVNGILTGTGLEEPVVWYNNEENFSIRLLTIPVEDIFYGFELILLTVLFFEMQLQRKAGTVN